MGRRAAPAYDHRLEGLDGLRAALLLDHEVLAREARHRPVVLVEHDHVEAHEVDARAEDRRRRDLGLWWSLPATDGGSEQKSEGAEGAESANRGRSKPHADSRPDAAGRVNEPTGW